MPKVFVVSRSSHDFSPARRYGDLVFLSEGPMDRYSANNMVRQFAPVLEQSSPEDYLLPCGLSVMNMMAACLMVMKHGRLNLLLYKNKTYREINLVFDEGEKE